MRVGRQVSEFHSESTWLVSSIHAESSSVTAVATWLVPSSVAAAETRSEPSFVVAEVTQPELHRSLLRQHGQRFSLVAAAVTRLATWNVFFQGGLFVHRYVPPSICLSSIKRCSYGMLSLKVCCSSICMCLRSCVSSP